MAQLFFFGISVGLLLISVNVQPIGCHPDIQDDMEVINKTVMEIREAHTNIRTDMDGLYAILLEDINKAGLLKSASEGSEPEVAVKDLAIEDKTPVITRRLDRLEETISALERYVYHENVESKETLRSLWGKSGEAFNANMDEVRKLSDNMIAEVDNTLAGVREDLKETEATANSRNVIVGDILYYQGIASACDDWYDSCFVEDSECRDGKCQCAPGLSYDSLRQRCVAECAHSYGDTYQVVHHYIIRGFNNRSLNETSLDDCKLLCDNEETFECRSFDYFPDHDNCYLSEHTKLTAEDGWEYNSVGVHFQRDCAYDKY